MLFSVSLTQVISLSRLDPSGTYFTLNVWKYFLTGLDPAGPLFYTGRYLKAGDAEFVDIIHTDEGLLGQVEHSGDVDFLPNGGHTPQPGCPVMPISIGSESS